MPDRDRGLFFFHNPKAGGSSIRRVLGSLFPPAAHCPLIENTERDHERRAGNYRGFRGHRYYAGHYGHDIFRVVEDRHDPVSNFRDPAARLLSLYNFYRIRVPLPRMPHSSTISTPSRSPSGSTSTASCRATTRGSRSTPATTTSAS